MESKRKGESTCPRKNQSDREKKKLKKITTGLLRKSFGRGS